MAFFFFLNLCLTTFKVVDHDFYFKSGGPPRLLTVQIHSLPDGARPLALCGNLSLTTFKAVDIGFDSKSGRSLSILTENIYPMPEWRDAIPIGNFFQI